MIIDISLKDKQINNKAIRKIVTYIIYIFHVRVIRIMCFTRIIHVYYTRITAFAWVIRIIHASIYIRVFYVYYMHSIYIRIFYVYYACITRRHKYNAYYAYNYAYIPRVQVIYIEYALNTREIILHG